MISYSWEEYMGILKDSTKKKEIQSLSVALWNELQNVDEEYAKS